jgi:hypothetical protein
MLESSPLVEALRARPVALLVCVLIAFVLVWWLAAFVAFASPPADSAALVMAGRAGGIAPDGLAPLPVWIASFAWRAGGTAGLALAGILTLAAALVAVYRLAWRFLGTRQAVIAVLLTLAVWAATAQAPAFGPGHLVAFLWPVALRLAWDLGETAPGGDWGRLGGLAATLGALILTTPAAWMFLLAFVFALGATERLRPLLARADLWFALFGALLPALPSLASRAETGGIEAVFAVPSAAPLLGVAPGMALPLLLAAGLVPALVLALAAGLPRGGRDAAAPIFERAPVPAGARTFVVLAALVPLPLALAESLWRCCAVTPLPAAGLSILTGLIAVMLAADRLSIHRQHAVGWLVALALFLPPLGLLAAAPALPFLFAWPTATQIDGPALGSAGAETFARETGKPLAFVIGEGPEAAALALAAAGTPRLIDPARLSGMAPALRAEIAARGALVVWSGPSPTMPPSVAASLSGLSAPVRLPVPYRIEGRLPPASLHLAVLRPANRRFPQAPPSGSGNRARRAASSPAAAADRRDAASAARESRASSETASSVPATS